MTYTVDSTEALRRLKDAVDLKGEDYVYLHDNGTSIREAPAVSCVNKYRDGSPACIVGHVLVALADGGYFTRDQIPDGGSVALAAENLPVKFTEDALLVLGRAQSRQDTGRTWGEAYAAAQEAVAVWPA